MTSLATCIQYKIIVHNFKYPKQDGRHLYAEYFGMLVLQKEQTTIKHQEYAEKGSLNSTFDTIHFDYNPQHHDFIMIQAI